MRKTPGLALFLISLIAIIAPLSGADVVGSGGRWVGTWSTSNLPTPVKEDTPAFKGATLRQVVHLSTGGERVRVRIANLFGTAPLELQGAHVAVSRGNGAIDPATDRVLSFGGAATVSIPAGAYVWSDPVDLKVSSLSDLAISVMVSSTPQILSAHGGSRAYSYLQAGDVMAADELPQASRFVHWYFISGVDVFTDQPGAAAIVTLGDSITDGYGTKPDTNTRWPDAFARLLAARAGSMPFGILNNSIGGNRLLRDGLGPNILARYDRDVIAQAGVRWVVVLAGINDIGTRLDARKNNLSYATAEDVIAAYDQFIERAHTHGLKIYGATITPFEGNVGYWCEDGEADRQKINHWIRTSGRFDAVIDFDEAIRDPSHPARLAPAYDSGDHLHPSVEGYKKMAGAVALDLFLPKGS